MSLTVKAYFDKGPREDCEIRRFAVDAGVSSSITYLKSKIQQVFPSLSGQSFDLFWKDADSDKVAFSTDEELTDALGFVNDGVFRIYIQLEKATPKNESEVHPGVVCDGCESKICGSRFKCLECQDYDLCCVCESRGEHADHRMLRLRSPSMTPYGFENICGGPGFPPFGGPPHGQPPPPGPHGGPPQHPPPPPMGPWGAFGGGFGGGRPGWPFRKMMKRCWKQWMRNMMMSQDPNSFGTESTADSEEEQNKCKEPRKDPKQFGCRKENEQMQSDGCDTGAQGGQDGGDNSQEEYLRNVGESVAAMLDPLGISVDVDVETSGKRKRCHGGRGWGRGRGRRGGGLGGFGPWGAGMWGGMGGGGGGCGSMGRGGPWGAFWAGGAGGQGDQQNENQPASDEPRPSTSQTQKPGEQGTESSEQAQSCPEASAPSPADVQMNSPSHPGENDGDWQMLNKEPQSTNSMEANPTSPPHNQGQDPPFQIYPSLEQQHSNPKINEALKQLLAMGFNNDGGWLVSLLEAKNGDLNRTLDALKPHKPQPH